MVQVTAQAQNPADDKKKIPGQTIPTGQIHGKESEPANEEKLLKEIVEVSREADEEAETKVRREISEIRAGEPRPSLPKEVAESGVISPDDQATEVLKKGSTINLGLTEEEYKTGLKEKVKASVVDKNVLGIASLIGLVVRAGRLIKESHKKAMNLVFKKKKGEENAG